MRRMHLSKILFAAIALGAGVAQAQETTNTWIVSDGLTNDSDIDFSGTTPAQTTAETSGTFKATATLSSVIYYTVDDNLVACGTLNATDVACTESNAAARDAQITVKSNVPYALTVTDSGGANDPDQVTLENTSVPGDTFYLPLSLTADVGTITANSGVWEAAETNAQVITISPTAVSDLDYTDDAGSYEGLFTVTIAAQ